MEENLLNVAIAAAVAAGREILKVYATDFEVAFKEDHSPITEADQKANDIILKYLHQTEIPIISEETKHAAYEERQSWNRCWIVDPLDGTKEFTKRNGEFTVNIALAEKGRPILGVIYVPVARELYFANLNLAKKAFKALLNKDYTLDNIFDVAQELKPSNPSKKLLRVAGSRSHLNAATREFIEKMKMPGQEIEIVSKGSALKFCLMAEGQADVYPRFSPTMEWDAAAGQAICEAVGLKVIDPETKRPLQYNKQSLYNGNFLVTL